MGGGSYEWSGQVQIKAARRGAGCCEHGTRRGGAAGPLLEAGGALHDEHFEAAEGGGAAVVGRPRDDSRYALGLAACPNQRTDRARPLGRG